MLVVVDAGHGGTDPGATGHGLKEATLTLKIAKRLRAALLRDFDVEVAMTRSTDRAVELHRRAKSANDLGADYFVSVHINSGGGTGYEDFVHTSVAGNSQSARRRSVVHDAVMTFMRARGMSDRGKKKENLAVLRERHTRGASPQRLAYPLNPDRERRVACGSEPLTPALGAGSTRSETGQCLEFGGRHGAVTVDVEPQAGDFLHALHKPGDRKVRMAVLREATEGWSKVLPSEEAGPVVDALSWLQLLGVEVLVCLWHPAESCARPRGPVQ